MAGLSEPIKSIYAAHKKCLREWVRDLVLEFLCASVHVVFSCLGSEATPRAGGRMLTGAEPAIGVS